MSEIAIHGNKSQYDRMQLTEQTNDATNNPNEETRMQWEKHKSHQGSVPDKPRAPVLHPLLTMRMKESGRLT